tara:strand:- start:115 stop:657 length:543 start_codon:yes stop_codon:yes gene_type:complete
MKLDPLSLKRVNEYLDLVHNVLPQLNTPEEKNEFWLSQINPEPFINDIGGRMPSYLDMQLPMALFLIHPHFHCTKKGTVKTPRYRESNQFSEADKVALMSGECKIGELIEDLHCGGTDTVSDHDWPWSLGGPTRGANHRELCSACNGQKANSVILFNWNEELKNLSWLTEILGELHEAKQ